MSSWRVLQKKRIEVDRSARDFLTCGVMHWKEAIMIAYISMATGFFTAYGTYHGHLWKWRDAKERLVSDGN